MVFYLPCPYGCRTVCGVSSVCLISCSAHLLVPCLRWDDGPGEPAVLHPHQPFSRYQTGAARHCVSSSHWMLQLTVTTLQNDKPWPKFLGPCAGTWSDRTLSLRYPTRTPTGSAVPDSQRATGSKCRTAPTCDGQKQDKHTANCGEEGM